MGGTEYSRGAPALFVTETPGTLGRWLRSSTTRRPRPSRRSTASGSARGRTRAWSRRGPFYPIKSMKAEERLWWYSRFFDCVEVNSTFYAPLSAQNAVLWAKRTPPGFLFSVKAYALLTGHHLDAGRLPAPLAGMLPASARPNARGQFENAVFPARPRATGPSPRSARALQPLADAGKLGYVLFQMAPWVQHGREALDVSREPSRAAARHHDRGGIPRRLVAAAAHRRDRCAAAAHGLTYVSVDAPRTPASCRHDRRAHRRPPP